MLALTWDGTSWLHEAGRTGGWTETLSCMALVQETLLQSWDGAIRLFPYWLKTNDVAFAKPVGIDPAKPL